MSDDIIYPSDLVTPANLNSEYALVNKIIFASTFDTLTNLVDDSAPVSTVGTPTISSDGLSLTNAEVVFDIPTTASRKVVFVLDVTINTGADNGNILANTAGYELKFEVVTANTQYIIAHKDNSSGDMRAGYSPAYTEGERNIFVIVFDYTVNQAPNGLTIYKNGESIVSVNANGTYKDLSGQWKLGDIDQDITIHSMVMFDDSITTDEINETIRNPYQLFETISDQQQAFHLKFDGTTGQGLLINNAGGSYYVEITLTEDLALSNDTYLFDGRYPSGSGTGYIYRANNGSMLSGTDISALNLNGSSSDVATIGNAKAGDVIRFLVGNAQSGSFILGARYNLIQSATNLGLGQVRLMYGGTPTASRAWEFNQTRGTQVRDYLTGTMATLLGFDESGSIRAQGLTDGFEFGGGRLDIAGLVGAVTCKLVLGADMPTADGNNNYIYDARGNGGSAQYAYSTTTGTISRAGSSVFSVDGVVGVHGDWVGTTTGQTLGFTLDIGHQGLLTIGATSTGGFRFNGLVIASIEITDDSGSRYYNCRKVINSTTIVDELGDGSTNATLIGFDPLTVFVAEKVKTPVGQEFGVGQYLDFQPSAIRLYTGLAFTVTVEGFIYSGTGDIVICGGSHKNRMVLTATNFELRTGSADSAHSYPLTGVIPVNKACTLIITRSAAGKLDVTIDGDVIYTNPSITTIQDATLVYYIGARWYSALFTSTASWIAKKITLLNSAAVKIVYDLTNDTGATILDSSGGSINAVVKGGGRLRNIFDYSSGHGNIIGRKFNGVDTSAEATLLVRAANHEMVMEFIYLEDGFVCTPFAGYGIGIIQSGTVIDMVANEQGTSYQGFNVVAGDTVKLKMIWSDNGDSTYNQEFQIAINGGSYSANLGTWIGTKTFSTLLTNRILDFGRRPNTLYTKVIWINFQYIESAVVLRNYDFTTGDINLNSGGVYEPHVLDQDAILESIVLESGVTYDSLGANFNGTADEYLTIHETIEVNSGNTNSFVITFKYNGSTGNSTTPLILLSDDAEFIQINYEPRGGAINYDLGGNQYGMSTTPFPAVAGDIISIKFAGDGSVTTCSVSMNGGAFVVARARALANLGQGFTRIPMTYTIGTGTIDLISLSFIDSTGIDSRNYDFIAQTIALGSDAPIPFIGWVPAYDHSKLGTAVTYDETGATYDGTDNSSSVLTTWTASGEFTVSGKFTTGSGVDSGIFVGGGTNNYLGEVAGLGFIFNFNTVYNSSDVITLARNTEFTFTATRDSNNLITYEIDGNVGSFTSAGDVTYLTLGKNSGGFFFNSKLTELTLMRVGDNRNFDFTNIKEIQTGGTVQPSIEETVSGRHAVIANPETSGWMPVIDYADFDIGAGLDYNNLPDFWVARKATAGISRAHLHEMDTANTTTMWGNGHGVQHGFEIVAAKGFEPINGIPQVGIPNARVYGYDIPHLLFRGVDVWIYGRRDIKAYNSRVRVTVSGTYSEHSWYFRDSIIDTLSCTIDNSTVDIINCQLLNKMTLGTTATKVISNIANCIVPHSDHVVDIVQAYYDFGSRVNISHTIMEAANALTSSRGTFLVNQGGNEVGVDFSSAFNSDGSISQTFADANLVGKGWNNTDICSWAYYTEVVGGDITLTLNDITLNTYIDKPTIARFTAVVLNDITLSTYIDTLTLQQLADIEIVLKDISLNTYVDQLKVSRFTNLTLKDVSLNTYVDQLSLSRFTNLTLKDITSNTYVDSLSVSRFTSITPNDITLPTHIDGLRINRFTQVELLDVTLAVTVDQLNLQRFTSVELKDITLQTYVDMLSLTTGIVLTLKDITLQTYIDKPSVQRFTTLDLQDVTLPTYVDELAISRYTALEFNDITLQTYVDNLILITGFMPDFGFSDIHLASSTMKYKLTSNTTKYKVRRK